MSPADEANKSLEIHVIKLTGLASQAVSSTMSVKQSVDEMKESNIRMEEKFDSMRDVATLNSQDIKIIRSKMGLNGSPGFIQETKIRFEAIEKKHHEDQKLNKKVLSYAIKAFLAVLIYLAGGGNLSPGQIIQLFTGGQ